MSKWDDFKKSVGIIADRTVAKTRELTDTASLKIKIASKEADRDTEYKVLGKLAYAKLKKLALSDSGSVTERISETIERIDKLNAEISALKAEEKARQAAKEAEKAAKAAEREKEEADKAEEEDDGEIVMDLPIGEDQQIIIDNPKSSYEIRIAGESADFEIELEYYCVDTSDC